MRKAAARWEAGNRVVRPTVRFRHLCKPELPEGVDSALVFLDDWTVFWNYSTLRDLRLLDDNGQWRGRVAIYDGELFVETGFCESECQEPDRGRLKRQAAEMLRLARRGRGGADA